MQLTSNMEHLYMTQTDLLEQLESDLRKLLEIARAQFAALPEEALQVRPQPERWNANECFAHLNAHFFAVDMCEGVYHRPRGYCAIGNHAVGAYPHVVAQAH